MPVSEKTKQDTIKALDGMREIVRHEMLTTGDYIESNTRKRMNAK